MNKNKKIWDQILNLIRDDISNEIHFENFGNCRILLSNNNDLIISGTKINIELLQDDYLSKLQESANQILEKR
ncbi:hypothetical protein [Mycoplasmoides fastidiosum]|uniref:hypothetical protein n=1 Tax=Mycoplasmoides fastidiosum TaxID=92758 RepID=UPI00211403AE|nr:hypothetical protein [Mycoplasmoides fastidiosum]UUD37772.1 hypothetical protein NPA10_04380 [Mycoplasmoides fastidiosum]